MDMCKTQFGSLVADYQNDYDWMDLFGLDPNLADLRKSLNAFFLNQKEDELIWGSEPNGFFPLPLPMLTRLSTMTNLVGLQRG